MHAMHRLQVTKYNVFMFPPRTVSAVNWALTKSYLQHKWISDTTLKYRATYLIVLDYLLCMFLKED